MVRRVSCWDDFRHVSRIFSRLLCVVLVLVQGSFIDFYLVAYASSIGVDPIWLIWMLGDAINCVLFSINLTVSYKYISKEEGRRVNIYNCLQPSLGNKAAGQLPLGYITWLVYSITIVARVGIFFTSEGPGKLHSQTFGPNGLKVTIGLTILVFWLLCTISSGAKSETDRARYVFKHVLRSTIDLVDATTLLDVLLPQKHEIIPLNHHTWNSIQAFSYIGFLLPTTTLFVLSRTQFGDARDRVRPPAKILFSCASLLLINVPFMTLRLYLWFAKEYGVSMLLFKNTLMILIGLKEIFGYAKPEGGKVHPEEEAEAEEGAGDIPGRDPEVAKNDAQIT